MALEDRGGKKTREEQTIKVFIIKKGRKKAKGRTWGGSRM